LTVDTIRVGCQTRYTLRDGAGLWCMLAFGPGQAGLAEWEILLPSGGRRDVLRRFAAPAAVRLRAWLAPIIGAVRAVEFTAAVAARPPLPADAPAAPGLSIPRQRDNRST
jgi:hypothetical protein